MQRRRSAACRRRRAGERPPSGAPANGWNRSARVLAEARAQAQGAAQPAAVSRRLAEPPELAQRKAPSSRPATRVDATARQRTEPASAEHAQEPGRRLRQRVPTAAASARTSAASMTAVGARAWPSSGFSSGRRGRHSRSRIRKAPSTQACDDEGEARRQRRAGRRHAPSVAGQPGADRDGQRGEPGIKRQTRRLAGEIDLGEHLRDHGEGQAGGEGGAAPRPCGCGRSR